MRATEQHTDPLVRHAAADRLPLEHCLAEVLHARPPARLLVRLAEVVGVEEVLLLSSDLRPLGFGAYRGQLCLVTATKVVLVTGTQVQGEDAAFGLEQWSRQVGVLPRALPRRTVPPAPRRG